MKRFGVGATLLVLGALTFGDPLDSVVVNPEPGAWTGPVTVGVQPPAGASVQYRFLETPSSTSFPWSGPLVLDALPGEKRAYTLRLSVDLPTGESVTRDYRYLVARPAEPLPTVRPVPGIYTRPVTVTPTLPPGWSLSVGGLATETPVLDAPNGTERRWVLDLKGPGGKALTWVYTVDLRDQGAPSVDVLSPSPGTWANAQSLVVVFQGVDRVLWTPGPAFDPTRAREYEGPVVLDAPGPQTITVGGRSRSDGRWVTKTVSWTNGTAAPPAPTWPTSSSTLEFPGVPGLSVSWDEGRSWAPASAHREPPATDGRKILAVQAKAGESVYRYVYWLDARPATTPALAFTGGWNPEVAFSGSVEAFHRVTWTFADGKTAEGPGLWGPSGAWKVPDGVVGARVTARGANGVAAAPASLGFSATGWSTPEWEPWDQKGPVTDKTTVSLGGRVLPRPGFTPVYEVSDGPDVPEPQASSPVLTGALVPTVPWGADRTFWVRLAWRDASGLVGPATEPLTLRVDRVPPPVPDVVQVGGQLLLSVPGGDTELFWAVTPERVTSAEGLTFQPYRTALDVEALRAEASGKLWLHAQARDPAGNVGPARLNVALGTPTSDGAEVVQVDPDPSVGEVDVGDGVYPWSEFRLRPADRAKNYWVGVADRVVPADWGTRVQPWTTLVSRSVAPGERRTFLVYWNEKTADGWAWAQPKVLSLTLDQGPPAPPVVEGTWPAGPLAGPWSLTVRPGRPGDSLRYSFSLDGSLPPDPLKAGQTWPGTVGWDAPTDGKVVVRVRLVAVSVAGQPAEVPLPGPVTLDRRVPAAVVPNLEPFTWSPGPVVVPAPAGAPVVRYTLTTDGSTPGIPGPSSPVWGTGLVLDGSPDRTVLYRFRWRPYSEAGLPGPPGDAFSVLVDRTPGPVVPPATQVDNVVVAPPRIVGFPGSGVTSSPVVLSAEATAGTLRYEVSEGVALPRPVSAQSPVWPGSLTLGAPGVDRVYHLSARRFGTDGIPGSPEVSYAVRIDQSPPGPAAFDLVNDARRPEAGLRPTPGNPDEALVYRWLWDTYPGERSEGPWTELSATPVFSAPPGALARLTVQAKLRDEAGNEGPVVEKTVLVDQNVVYVSPQGGGDGSRNHPLGALTDALAKARKEGKTAVFLAAGPLAVGKTLELGGLQLYGGWDPALWETGPATRTVVSASAPFQGTSFVEVGDRDLALQGVDLVATEGLQRVVSARAADIVARDAAFTWSAGQVGWVQSGGTVTLNGVTLAWTAQGSAALVDWKGVEFHAKNLGITSSRNAGVLVSLREGASVVQDLRIASKRAVGYEGLVSVSGGTFTADGARLMAGEGADQVVALVAKNADVGLWDTEIDLYGEKANTGLQVQGGHLEVQNSTVNLLKGGEFNQGLVLVKTDALVQGTTVKVDAGAYQGGLTVDSSSLRFQNATVVLAGGGKKAWGAQFLGVCPVTMADARWALGTKTPGDVWLVQKPWAEGSTAVRSTATGW